MIDESSGGFNYIVGESSILWGSKVIEESSGGFNYIVGESSILWGSKYMVVDSNIVWGILI